MSDLKEIKKRILKENKIPFLLERMGCEFIEPRGNRYEAQRPGGNNKRSVQVYLSESLPCRVRTQGQNNLDLFDLISFIVFEKTNEPEQKNNLGKAKKWLCEQLGYDEYVNGNYKPEKKLEFNQWLHDLRKKRKKIKSLNDIEENKVLDESIMMQFVNYPHIKWVNEGLTCKTQREFGVGFDIESERIVFPVHNENGELIGVKGRYTGTDEEIEKYKKYRYIFSCNKSIELFNLHRAKPYILKEKKVLVFEGAKSTFYSSQYGIKNTVSIEGDFFDDIQIQKLKNLGMGIDIILMFDKDKTKDFIKEQSERITNRNVYGMYDKDNLLGHPELKKSPTDFGYDVFYKLYSEHIYKIKETNIK